MNPEKYEQLREEAVTGVERFFEDQKASLKGFQRDSYPEIFQNMMQNYEPVFFCIEEIYNVSEEKETWLEQLADRLISAVRQKKETVRGRFKKQSMQTDCNMYMVAYVFPAILEYDGKMSRPFAELLKDRWNEAFGTKLDCGNYELIYSGFRTTILGIPFGK